MRPEDEQNRIQSHVNYLLQIGCKDPYKVMRKNKHREMRLSGTTLSARLFMENANRDINGKKNS